MPNNHYPGIKMGDCNLKTLSYNPKCEDKYCKYSYSTWCSTCERNSPRRRSRSETNEHCRRRCKEMKTFTPKKYSTRSHEYENMELEYGNWYETSKDCCRIRSNLCELPTTYISNNCQNTMSKLTGNDTSDFVECLKTVRTLKFVDYNQQLQNFGSAMQDIKQNSLFEALQHKVSPTKEMSPKTKQFLKHFNQNVDVRNHLYKDNQFGDFKHANSSKKPSNCKDSYCSIAQDLPERKPVYSTENNLHPRYTKEVEYLRERLRGLKNEAYNNHVTSVRFSENTDIGTTTKAMLSNLSEDMVTLKESVISTPMEIKPKLKREKKIISPPMLRSNKTKVALKTRIRSSSAKLRKVKSKTPLPVTTVDCPESDNCSNSDESEKEISDGEEESDFVSDPPSEASNKDFSENEVSVAIKSGGGDTLGWPIRPSLFPNIPPYIKFNTHDSDVPFKIPTGRKFFKWKLSTITPVVVRKTLTNSGFALVRKSNQWLGTWGKHMKSPMFKTLKDTQKLNHFPGTFQLGRKDRLWRNFQRLINKFGHKEFGFLPHTYVLPQELKLLKQNWEFKNGSGGEMWIIKPPASARGVGIKVINKWSQLPKKMALVVQKYISNPYLINGSKFDLRLYVLVTSFHPLRIYLYPDGLARFASAKYSDDAKDLKDRYMHLTNYSINKLSSQYTANEDANACQGHKWTISKLMEYLENEQGIDTKALWKSLQQLVIKTIITAEPPITQLCEENMNSTYNCYELFGVDVLLDENLKPWLLEVNISPSLHSASPLDAHVKGPLVQTLFDMAQFHFPPRLSQSVKQSPQCYDSKLYSPTLTKKERAKHVLFSQYEGRDDYLDEILKDLTGDDVRHLTRAEDEYSVKGRFERVFPSKDSWRYMHFMEVRYYNRLFDAWEWRYANRRNEGIDLLKRLCSEKIHMKVAPQSTLSKSSPSTIHGDIGTNPPPAPAKESHNRPLEEIMQQTSITSDKNLAIPSIN